MANPELNTNVKKAESLGPKLRAEDDGYFPLKIDHDREAPLIRATLFTQDGIELPQMKFTVDGLSAMIKAGLVIGGGTNPETPKPEGPRLIDLEKGKMTSINSETGKKRPTRKTAA